MGVPFSMLGKLGLPSVDSLTTDQAYDNYFKDKDTKNYEEFHCAFIELCRDLNLVMPGKHYIIDKSRDEIKTFYKDVWLKIGTDEKKQDGLTESEKKKDSGTDESKEGTVEKKLTESEKKKKEELIKFMEKTVKEFTPSSGVMIWTGLGAPAGAVLLKRSGEKVPQLKKLRLNLVPNVIFVPSITLLSLVGARMLTMKSAISNKTH